MKELFFIYGTLKTDGSNNYIMNTACGEFLYPCSTVEKYYKGETSFYPYLSETINENKQIQEGELWEVPSTKIEYLDAFEGAPDLFDRYIIKVEFENIVTSAWCYFLKGE